jgi:hypothetical protein
MTTDQAIEKMPEFVTKAIGDVQKKLTVWEGEARKTIKANWKKFKKNPSYKKVKKTLDKLQTEYTQKMDIAPYKKKVDKYRAEFSNKAFDTIGVATKSDIKTITRKINSLKAEVRKMGGTKTTTRTRRK